MREATSNSGEEKYIYKIWVLPDDVISAVLVVASYVMMTVEAEAIMTSYSFNQPDENILISPLHIRYFNLTGLRLIMCKKLLLRLWQLTIK